MRHGKGRAVTPVVKVTRHAIRIVELGDVVQRQPIVEAQGNGRLLCAGLAEGIICIRGVRNTLASRAAEGEEGVYQPGLRRPQLKDASYAQSVSPGAARGLTCRFLLTSCW